jgi:F-type H+-transporting ATPase subunit b
MTDHGSGHHPGLDTLLWPVVNFTVFAVVMVRVMRGPVREYFRTRSGRIRDALAAGARARQEAEDLRATLARDVAALPELRERLRNDLREAATRERDNILESARRAAERLRTDARLLADHEVAAARESLRAEVIEEAIRQATDIIRQTAGPEDQARFVRDFVGGAGARA